MTLPLWSYDFITVSFSLVISVLLLLRWRKGKDSSLLYWAVGFLSFALSYFLSVLFIAGVFPSSGFLYEFLHFTRQSLVSVFFLLVYLGVTILVTKKRFWTRTFPILFLFLQIVVTAYYDFVGSRILFAENLHIFLFDIPFNVVICVLFMRYFIMSFRRFSFMQSIAWFGYLVLVSISFGIQFSPLFYGISLLPMLVMLVGFIDYYRRPISEHILEITPKIEEGAGSEKLKYNLKPGSVHLIIERKPVKSFDVFSNYVKNKYYGLGIIRKNPLKVRDLFGLKLTPLLWLTRIETSQKYVNPLELEQVTFAVTDFIDKVATQNSVIILEGIEYLAASNEFPKVLHAMSMIKDKVSSSKCVMVVPIDKGAITSQDYTLLLREFE